MIPYYDELNDEEKDAVTKVIRTLLRHTENISRNGQIQIQTEQEYY